MGRLRALVQRLLGRGAAPGDAPTDTGERRVPHRRSSADDRAIQESEMREAARLPVEGMRGIW